MAVYNRVPSTPPPLHLKEQVTRDPYTERNHSSLPVFSSILISLRFAMTNLISRYVFNSLFLNKSFLISLTDLNLKYVGLPVKIWQWLLQTGGPDNYFYLIYLFIYLMLFINAVGISNYTASNDES